MAPSASLIRPVALASAVIFCCSRSSSTASRASRTGDAVETDDLPVRHVPGEDACGRIFSWVASPLSANCPSGLSPRLEGKIDLALTQVQRADVEFRRGVHADLSSERIRTLKPATEPFSSVARAASSPTASAVFAYRRWPVPSRAGCPASCWPRLSRTAPAAAYRSRCSR